MAVAGYSGTPLPQKLGVKPGMTVHVVDPPMDYAGYKSTALRHPKEPLIILPHRLTEGTQGLALLGALGGVFFMAAGVACVAAPLPAAR